MCLPFAQTGLAQSPVRRRPDLGQMRSCQKEGGWGSPRSWVLWFRGIESQHMVPPLPDHRPAFTAPLSGCADERDHRSVVFAFTVYTH